VYKSNFNLEFMPYPPEDFLVRILSKLFGALITPVMCLTCKNYIDWYEHIQLYLIPGPFPVVSGSGLYILCLLFNSYSRF